MNHQDSAALLLRHTIACALVLLGSCAASLGSVEYAVIQLSPPPGYYSLAPNDINDAGQVAGTIYQPAPPDMSQYLLRGFLWQTGAVQVLPELPGYRSADAWEINQAGTIVGRLFLTNDSFLGSITVTWGPSGVTNRAPSHNAGRLAFECAINNLGNIAGVWAPTGSDGERSFAVIDGQFLDLLPASPLSQASGMNDSNVVVGTFSSFSSFNTQAFMWSQTTGLTTLDTVADKQGLATAHAINNHGMIIGRRWTNGLDGAYCYVQGTVTDLGALGGTNSSPYDLNDRGIIVGTADTSTILFGHQAVTHAFVYSPAQGMRDLNDLIAKDSGWTLTTAKAINNYGQIVGSGTLNRQSQAFLLQPLPGIALTGITNGVVALSLSNLVPGTTYAIQRSEALLPATWDDAVTIVAGAETFDWSEAFCGDGNQVFYRVVGR